MMDDMFEEWKKELIGAGLLKPDQDISQVKLMTMWQSYQLEKMRGMMSGTSPVENPFESMTAEKLGLVTTEVTYDDSNVNPLEGIKAALNALLIQSEGASYCMIVVGRAWINFRYKRSSDNLHLQVAGNQYISPMELSDSDIKNLEAMGLLPEEGSVDIWATDFDDTPRDFDKIVETAMKVFNDIYHIEEGESAYVELDLGNGEDESIRKEISQFFRSHDGKKFKWDW